jgi:hypothetical protein
MSDQITNTIKTMAGFTPFGMGLIFDTVSILVNEESRIIKSNVVFEHL